MVFTRVCAIKKLKLQNVWLKNNYLFQIIRNLHEMSVKLFYVIGDMLIYYYSLITKVGMS